MVKPKSLVLGTEQRGRRRGPTGGDDGVFLLGKAMVASRHQALPVTMRPAQLKSFLDTSIGTKYCSVTFSFAKSIQKSGHSVPFPEFNTYYPPGTSNNRSSRGSSVGQLEDIHNLEASSGSSLMR